MFQYYPEEVQQAVYYNLLPYKDKTYNDQDRELLIEEITKKVSVSSSPRKKYNMSIKDVNMFVTHLFDKHTKQE